MVWGIARETYFEGNNPLIGTWQLLEHGICDASGRESYPHGKAVTGYATYVAEGYMSLTAASQGRSRFASGDRVAAGVGEWVAAAKTYLSFCGRYEVVEPQRALYHIETSLFPNWTGTTQECYFEVRGDRLQTSTPPLPYEGKLQIVKLRWQRLT